MLPPARTVSSLPAACDVLTAGWPYLPPVPAISITHVATAHGFGFRILADIEIQNELERAEAEQARKAEEARRLAEAEKAALEAQRQKDRLAAIERETYMSMKEARKAAEKEVRYPLQPHSQIAHPPRPAPTAYPPLRM